MSPSIICFLAVFVQKKNTRFQTLNAKHKQNFVWYITV